MQNSDAENNFKVRGLNPDATYNISIEQKQTGTFSGKQLMSEGININLNAVWSSAVAEIDEIK
jgi:hypothetical protein